MLTLDPIIMWWILFTKLIYRYRVHREGCNFIVVEENQQRIFFWGGDTGISFDVK